ncbi:helix-turn-helix domain-containing protein [Rossellomorea vietnamensis]|uniref:helix-turn-helix domain-containing protein n=1 Tax=Rossellomorea vietnamensis TaxID=218284 RepID=UPI001CCFEE60|nr:helix-turn-helix domain-containing protein [Rossellomorea vietnamensis]MCA0151541.1 helix-turn-helix domain-containing protein [Rossellomorea vietnamensis]
MVGEKIKEFREKKGMTIIALSNQSGISKSYISSIERGIQENPSIQILDKLSVALGVELNEILECNPNIDEEWIRLVKMAIKEGMTKQEFLEYIQFIQFKKRNTDRV